MGCKLKAEDFEYLQAVKDLGYLVTDRFVTPWMRFRYSSHRKKVIRLAKIMHDFTTKIIHQRRALVQREKAENLKNLDDDDVGLKKKMCLLDVLLQSTVDGQPLTDADIQEEVDTFTFAGETVLSSDLKV
jgi:cytochrome P450 family 4